MAQDPQNYNIYYNKNPVINKAIYNSYTLLLLILYLASPSFKLLYLK
jgi:hypothetical protein